MSWNFVALEPDSQRWQQIHGALTELGHRAIAVANTAELAAVLEAFRIDAVLLRPLGDLDSHRPVLNRLRRSGSAVYVTAEPGDPRVLSAYYALGDRSRVVRPEPDDLVIDLQRHRFRDSKPLRKRTREIAANSTPECEASRSGTQWPRVAPVQPRGNAWTERQTPPRSLTERGPTRGHQQPDVVDVRGLPAVNVRHAVG